MYIHFYSLYNKLYTKCTFIFIVYTFLNGLNLSLEDVKNKKLF